MIQVQDRLTLVTPECSAAGGKQTTRERIRDERDGASRETETKVLIHVTDVAERAEADRIVSTALAAVRRATTRSRIGYLATDDQLAKVDEIVREHAERARVFNENAKTCAVTVAYVPTPIVVALGSQTAKALADSVRSGLERVRDELRAGNVKKVRVLLRPDEVGSVGELAVGIQRDSILMALADAKAHLMTLVSKTAEQCTGVSETPESVGRGLDLSSIEAAIGLFVWPTDENA